MQKGQIFILGAIGLVIAMFLMMPNIHREIYFPTTDNPKLKNIAREYNYWISYLSMGDNYDVLNFGAFVKEKYPNIRFFYLLTKDKDLNVANFLDKRINFSINGKKFSLEPNKALSATFSGNINFSSDYKNFSYTPKNRWSGAIFIEEDRESTKLQLLKIFE